MLKDFKGIFNRDAAMVGQLLRKHEIQSSTYF